MIKEIKELEDKIAMWERLNVNGDLENQIAEAEAKIEELKQQDKSLTKDTVDNTTTKADIDKAFTKVDTKAQKRAKVEVVKIEESKADTVEADTIDDDTKADTIVDEEIEEIKADKIDFKQDVFLPTREDIRNNNIEEKGRGRQRNRNDVYKNLSIGLVCGKVVDNMDGEFAKVLYEKDIDERLEQLKNEGVTKLPSKSRLTKDLTLISNQLGAEVVNIVNTRDNGLCYIIKQSYTGKYFAPIPLYKWRELVVSTNKELLRLYMVISMHKDISTTNYVLMTREYLCKCMDIEPTEANQKYIGIAINSLFKLGMIDVEQEDRIEFEDGQRKNKTYNFYRLTTYEEYEEKGKKKKRKRKH